MGLVRALVRVTEKRKEGKEVDRGRRRRKKRIGVADEGY